MYVTFLIFKKSHSNQVCERQKRHLSVEQKKGLLGTYRISEHLLMTREDLSRESADRSTNLRAHLVN